MEDMTLEGAVTISNWSGSGDHLPETRCVTISITDKQSGVQFLKVSMTFEEFCRALMKQSYQPATLELSNLDLVGKKREHKTEEISVEGWLSSFNKKDVRKAEASLKPFEVDGWKGEVSDIFNRHRLIHYDTEKDTGTYRVSFFRYV